MLIRGSPKLNKHDLEDRFFRLQWKRRRNGEPREITKSVTLKVHSVCPVAKTLPTFSLHLCLPAATRRRIGSCFPPRPRTHVHLLCVPCIRNRSSLVSVARFFLYCPESRCRSLPFEFILEKTMSGIREKHDWLKRLRVTCVPICTHLVHPTTPDRFVAIESSEERAKDPRSPSYDTSSRLV